MQHRNTNELMNPLHNILDCMSMILFARSKARQEPWLAMVGECDHMAEIHRQLDECGDTTYSNRISPERLAKLKAYMYW